MGCHPADLEHGAPSGTHHISFYCDDVEKTVAKLKERGVEFTTGIEDHGYGLVTQFKLPGDFAVQLYQPRYKRNPPPAPKKKAKAKPKMKAKRPNRKRLPRNDVAREIAMLRVGLIGYGAWGAHHARVMAANPSVTLVAIAAKSDATVVRAHADHPQS